ncbi:hypothetical protein IFM89_003219 [Coptis chinensis]|uniref:DUF2415 domain-containing protein n=1 Tax=Coptis chinensis TaxID=261450 RepID=A0A835H633_9MAGN|nr:hypothetical protein IFM89_003219 [Coptis chinensis]
MRNLLWATSKHDAYLIENYSVMHWSSLLRSGQEVLNAAGQIVPAMKRARSFTQSLSRVQINTMAVKDNLMVAGGFHGELISALQDLMTGNNDPQMRVFDENFACLGRFTFPEHFISRRKGAIVLGDNVNCLIVDAQSGKTRGREESFSITLAVLKGRMGAIRAIKFSSDGRFMAMSEPADFVHIYDTQSEYSREQEIDLFGEIARISFSPDTEDLFVAVADRTYGNLLEYNRKRSNQYLYTII